MLCVVIGRTSTSAHSYSIVTESSPAIIVLDYDTVEILCYNGSNAAGLLIFVWNPHPARATSSKAGHDPTCRFHASSISASNYDIVNSRPYHNNSVRFDVDAFIFSFHSMEHRAEQHLGRTMWDPFLILCGDAFAELMRFALVLTSVCPSEYCLPTLER